MLPIFMPSIDNDILLKSYREVVKDKRILSITTSIHESFRISNRKTTSRYTQLNQ